MKRGFIAAILLIVSLCLLTACAPAQTEAPQGEPYAFAFGGAELIAEKEYDKTVLLSLNGETPYVSHKGSCWNSVAGTETKYVYAHFDLTTFHEGENDAKELVIRIDLKDDAVQTKKGISIGATVQAVKDAYGEPTKEDSSNCIYESGGTELRFNLRDGKVTNISYVPLGAE